MQEEALTSLARDIYDGEMLLAHLRHVADETNQRRNGHTRDHIRELEAKVSYLRRNFQLYILKAMGELTGTTLPEYNEALTKQARDRIKVMASLYEYKFEIE